ELLSLIQWLAILFGCATCYQLGGELLAQLTTMFSRLTCYVAAYVVVGLSVLLLFAGLKRAFGGKLLGSDIFGRAEYYLGMGSGLVRFTCILLTLLALLNARYFSPEEIMDLKKYEDDVYGSSFFPTLPSVQASVFEKSLTGPWIKANLGFLLIRPTELETKEIHMRDAGLP
ncbi:MAG: hypothetical protein NT154_44130, partial [Verrucomicrobia bacterium]|nr:hypothetical protein [Verrucomicrobiota bacterium]